jgi:tellurite resistance protein TerC
LAVVLAFVGVKMCIARWVPIPVQYSLLVIAAVLAGSVIASLAWPAEQDGAP